MKGTMLIYRPGKMTAEVTEMTAPPGLETLQKAVEGYIEAVPYFNVVFHQGTTRNCVAFCNEDGKRKLLGTNHAATGQWHMSIRRQRRPSLNLDVLVGPVVVLCGDEEFLGAV